MDDYLNFNYLSHAEATKLVELETASLNCIGDECREIANKIDSLKKRSLNRDLYAQQACKVLNSLACVKVRKQVHHFRQGYIDAGLSTLTGTIKH